ncbi:MAG TPA: pantoate--beta-alanine ligase [Flavobacteriaceae bacterium]|nr:pantoate--beta-alanine ligase [Flavobacteriaceae bacterium]
MKVLVSKELLKNQLAPFVEKKATIGFVPTMGALHQGHLSLVKKALKENRLVVVSVFVNPTQFDNAADLDKYPRMLEEDVALLKTVSENILVYAPPVNDVYEKKVKAEAFTFDGLEHEMEGKFRVGHFDGVGTIVKRLFEIIQPTRAYFGEKDYQQLLIVKKMVSSHNLPVQIVGCPILREKDGLAMSSRNTRLTAAQRKASPFIYKTLVEAKKKFGTKSANYVTRWVEHQFKNHNLLKLEYFIIAHSHTLKPLKRKTQKGTYRAFIAVYAGEVRLIDNIALN